MTFMLHKKLLLFTNFFNSSYIFCSLFLLKEVSTKQEDLFNAYIGKQEPVENFNAVWALKPVIFVPSGTFFSFAALLFSAGFIGVFFNNKNFLLLLLKAEVMFLGINLWFVGCSLYNNEYVGYVYALILFGLVAAETAIGLSLFLVFFFFKKTIMTDIFSYTPDEIRQANRMYQNRQYWLYMRGKKRRKYTELFID